jgi:RNA polymerase sigma-B factor
MSVLRETGRMRQLTIDLGGVPLLDAAGVGVLVTVHEAARVRDVQVRATGLQPYVARIAAASGLAGLIGR